MDITSLNPTVFIIDDDVGILQALKWLLESVHLRVKCFKSATEFLNIYDTAQCGCIVTDVRMPVMSGLQLLEHMNKFENNLPIIIITAHGDIPMAVTAMKNGAVDFISKPFNDQYLLEQIQKSISSNINQRLAQRQSGEKNLFSRLLTSRERQVIELIINGKLNKQIAQELNISISTVEFHRSRIMKKMRAKNLAQLIKHYLHHQEDSIN